MRYFVPAMVILALGACTSQVPDSGMGVGFDSPSSYAQQRANREAELQGQDLQGQNRVQTGALISDETPTGTQTRTAGSSISDEQDFDAVAERESIESDKERLARQKAQYVIIQPTAVPTGGGGQGAILVNFALSSTNKVGESIYNRIIIFPHTRHVRNCQRFLSPDKAQTDFLKSGGPQRDRRGLDPDGDGFACGWNPQPFRNARK